MGHTSTSALLTPTTNVNTASTTSTHRPLPRLASKSCEEEVRAVAERSGADFLLSRRGAAFPAINGVFPGLPLRLTCPTRVPPYETLVIP